MTELPVLLTPEQAGEVLGISRRAVLDLARAYAAGNAKGMPGVKVLRDWRFTAADIAAYVEANRTAPQRILPTPGLERVPIGGRARRGSKRPA